MKLLIELDYGSTLVLDHTPENAAAVNRVFGGGTWRSSWKVRDAFAPSSNEARMKLVRSVRLVTAEELEQLEREYDELHAAEKEKVPA